MRMLRTIRMISLRKNANEQAFTEGKFGRGDFDAGQAKVPQVLVIAKKPLTHVLVKKNCGGFRLRL